MSKVLAPLLRIEERALSIGLWFKRTSQREECIPELHGFLEPFLWRQTIPFRPFFADQILGSKLVLEAIHKY
jgi:hypothetical protein